MNTLVPSSDFGQSGPSIAFALALSQRLFVIHSEWLHFLWFSFEISHMLLVDSGFWWSVGYGVWSVVCNMKCRVC